MIVISFSTLPEAAVSARCQVTGAIPGFGHAISHSHRRTKRRFDPNIQRKTYFVPSLGRRVTLTLSTKGIKTIDKRGIDAVVASIIARGEKV
jgi:large subunit ribosomal protein L28